MIPDSDVRSAVESVEPGSLIVDVEHLPGGSSALVALVTLERPDAVRRDLIVRQHSDRVDKGHVDDVARREYEVLGLLAHAGLPVPAPLAVHGATWEGGPWLAMERVQGSSSIDPAELPSVLDQMAYFLTRLHALDPGGVAHVLEDIEDPVLELPSYLPDGELARAVRGELMAGFERSPNRRAVLHGDYWPGNVLVRDGRIAAVIDWEDAALGDPLVDLAAARLELICEHGQDAADRFADTYLATSEPLDMHDLPLWEMYVSATALATMHRWGLDPPDEEARRAETGTFFERAAAVFTGRSR